MEMNASDSRAARRRGGQSAKQPQRSTPRARRSIPSAPRVSSAAQMARSWRSPSASITSRRGCAGIAAPTRPTRRCCRSRQSPLLLLLHRDLAAGILLRRRAADHGRASACSSSPRASAGPGAATPARRPYGPTCSIVVERRSKATATPASSSTPAPWTARKLVAACRKMRSGWS